MGSGASYATIPVSPASPATSTTTREMVTQVIMALEDVFPPCQLLRVALQ